MNFETKYLIRWGIPGWVFIFWLFFYFSFTQNDYSEFIKNVPLLISLIVAGVPLGYLIYQVYFVCFWSFRTKDSLNRFRTELGDKFSTDANFGKLYENRNKDYYYLEHVWYSMLLEQDEGVRAYLEGRYRHLLSTIHGVGTLFVSTTGSLMLIFFLLVRSLITGEEPLLFYIGIVMQSIILVAASFNYRYFSDNLRAFQINMLNKYLS